MDIVKRSQLAREVLPGRVIQKAVGRDGVIGSDKMTMGFAHYSRESGPMAPHNHAEETIYVVDSKAGWVRYGSAADKLENKAVLQPGMILHFTELEWHVFEYEAGGYVDIIFFYGQVDNIRPEEIMQKNKPGF
ncbi:MAG: hypothetical protein K0R22_1470 [Sporomusa sp.]|jgi:uncharacterized RmlC-like cupin family protein|nr:hypothetical protein [Sporomusa sp.]